MLLSAMPLIISGRAIEEITDLFSPSTKEVLNDFIDQYFGLSPELKSILKDCKVFI
jgi:hypothetical protein